MKKENWTGKPIIIWSKQCGIEVSSGTIRGLRINEPITEEISTWEKALECIKNMYESGYFSGVDLFMVEVEE